MEYKFKQIGVIHSPFKEASGMPIQSVNAAGAAGTIEVFDEYVPGLVDLDGFSHIILLYVFHQNEGYELQVTPFRDNQERGLFATRAPKRPNPIGLSIVRLDKVEGHTLHVANLDVLDGTPLLDIKPFNPEIDHREDCRVGWMKGRFGNDQQHLSDERFSARKKKNESPSG